MKHLHSSCFTNSYSLFIIFIYILARFMNPFWCNRYTDWFGNFAERRRYCLKKNEFLLKSIFYPCQVYDSNSTNFTSTKEAVLTEASTRIRDYDLTLLSDSNVTFEANWMLLVTWRNVSAYTSEYLADYVRQINISIHGGLIYQRHVTSWIDVLMIDCN